MTASVDKATLRKHIGGAAAASAAGIYLTSPSLTGPLLPLAMALFWLSLPFLGVSRPGRVLLGLFALITASAWLSVPFSLLSGGNLAGTLWLAILTSVLVPLAWIRDVKPILQWLTPVWLLHACVSLYQWLFTEASRVTGLAEQANAAAAFMLLGCIYLMNGNNRAKWLILPMVAALPFTGSRWVAVVAAGVALGLFASKYVHWRYIAIAVAMTLALVLLVGWNDLSHVMFDRPSTLQVHIGGYPEQVDLPPSWVPRGFYDNGIHVVPWRMMHETGIASGLAWLAAGAYGLWKRPRYDYRWWLLLTVGLLSAMYYFTWIGPLGWAWWLVVRPSPTSSAGALSPHHSGA